MKISLTVNGTAHSIEVEPRTLLVDVLREQLRLTGTHVGCDTSQCGTCTVHVAGKPVKACSMLAVQADGQDVTTIEGVAKDGVLHPMQAAFREHHALQCGFCTPGMIMTALSIVERHKGEPLTDEPLTDEMVRKELEGNFCRCTGYQPIVAAILAGAKATV
ncbi:MAG: (2Fe-2S)-binding protein [Rhodospirillaceae bacterium]|nr:(2Fe-2S)-binding protein [Rhodospirillaceae bacterium]